jgi:hypothetical protein
MATSLGRWMSSQRALLVQLTGLASITGGLWMVYEPAALIVAGLLLVVGGAGLAPDEERE